MNLTFDQMTQEVAHGGTSDGNGAVKTPGTIARMLREQSADASNPAAVMEAQSIIELYRKGERNSGEDPGAAETARTQCLGLYEVWRYIHADAVAPIAGALGLPMPTAEAFPAETGPEASDVLFGGPIDPTRAPAPPQVASAAPAKTSDASKAAPVKRTRRAWQQAEIVAMTKIFLLDPSTDESRDVAVDAVIAHVRGDLTPDEVRGKAIELELMAAPPPAKTYEMSETDKKVMDTRVRQQLCVVDDPVVKMVQLKYAAGVLREFIKELAG